MNHLGNSSCAKQAKVSKVSLQVADIIMPETATVWNAKRKTLCFPENLPFLSCSLELGAASPSSFKIPPNCHPISIQHRFRHRNALVCKYFDHSYLNGLHRKRHKHIIPDIHNLIEQKSPPHIKNLNPPYD